MQLLMVSTLLHIMAKRRRGLRSGKDSKCRDKQSSIDRISMLPDELLLFILSLLTFKEATATSILSCRWRYLWTFMPKLDFDGTNLLLKVMSEKRKRGLLLDMERAHFIRCVSRGIELRDSIIEEFRVFFNLDKSCTRSIDKWLRYALARKVQRLELDLTDYGSRRSHKYDECYTFPYNLLRPYIGYFSSSSQSWRVRQCDSIDFKSLRKILMNYVNVNGEALEFFLRNCPLLEDLSVSQSGELSTLKIIGPVPSFKRLEISFCNNLYFVEIRDANLVYLKYEGSSRIHLLLENVPLLVEIFVGGNVTDFLAYVFSMFWRCLPQLEIFTIQRMGHFYWIETAMFYSYVKMSKLKQLVIKLDLYLLGDESLLPLTNFIRASPCLQRFVLEVLRLEPEYTKGKVNEIEGSYPHLKEVEFVGYYGLTSELELVTHFMEKAVALEKIVVDPRKPCKTPFGPKPGKSRHGYAWKYNPNFKDEFINEEMDARSRAKKQLTKKVPQGVNLEIL